MSRLDRQVGLKPGDVLGGYRLLIPVGAGGMGQVWAALRLGSPTPEPVALKIALENLVADKEFEHVFVDEARIASLIEHPNVCTIRELGSDRGTAYLVMQWVNGGTLHDILEASPSRRIDCYLAARIAASVCSGLHAAHELLDAEGNPLHVVHRDVSPQNILISDHGQVKVADFGIARARGQLHAPTRTGELKGKLSYMAPEQLTTKLFDRRADIFALGCVLYQATTGHRPFHGDDTLETMYRLLETDCPRPSALVPDYPMRLESIVLTALDKDISSRYQTAAEFEDELLRFLAARGSLATEADIAELVQSSLGEHLRQQAQQLEAALEATSSRSSHPPPESGAPKPPRSLRAAAQWTVLGALALSLTTTASLLSNRNPKSPLQHGTATATTPNTPMPAPTVQIDIATEPPGGWLRLDAGPMVRSPWHLDTAPSTAPHVIMVSLAGYQDQREVLTFEHSTKLLIRLLPNESERLASGALVRSPGRAEAATLVGTASASSKPPEWLPPRLRKPKRPLDPENPF